MIYITIKIISITELIITDFDNNTKIYKYTDNDVYNANKGITITISAIDNDKNAVNCTNTVANIADEGNSDNDNNKARDTVNNIDNYLVQYL